MLAATAIAANFFMETSYSAGGQAAPYRIIARVRQDAPPAPRAAPWSIRCSLRCHSSRLVLRAVRSTLATKAPNQTIAHARRASGCPASEIGRELGRESECERV